jgi:exonuclease SbcC
MDALHQSFGAAKENLEKMIREEQDLNNEMKKIKKMITDIGIIDKESEELGRKFQTIGTLSDWANGVNVKKITFQRYVQATFLDDVLIAASRRLTVMSKGRFHLRRVTEHHDRRKSGGLNLEIDDAYTGTPRPVSTLSGGESFLAALSLALGLADVVQSYSGGMRLDTLFIDEGFGSLDSESLDCALRTLMDLRKGGRLVAIISHVSELRERIDTRLEIIPGTAGSSARFVTL